MSAMWCRPTWWSRRPCGRFSNDTGADHRHRHIHVQGNGPNATEYSSVSVGSANTTETDLHNDKSSGDFATNSGDGHRAGLRQRRTNNGGIATTTFDNAFNTNKAVCGQQLEG